MKRRKLVPAQWFIRQNNDDKSGPFSSKELAELATSGKLHPQDRVRKDGMKTWVEASHVRGLFQDVPTSAEQRPVLPTGPGNTSPVPPNPLDFLRQSPSSSIKGGMLQCRTCSHSLSVDAAICPCCGAPNNWLHPAIERFRDSISTLNFLPEKSLVFWKGNRVWGTGSQKYPKSLTHPVKWGPRVMISSFILWMVFWRFAPYWAAILLLISFIGFLGTMVGMFLAAVSSDQVVNFDLDFSYMPPRWSCNNESYWADVRKFFELRDYPLP